MHANHASFLQINLALEQLILPAFIPQNSLFKELTYAKHQISFYK